MGIFDEIQAEMKRSRELHPGTDDIPDGTWEGGMRKYQRTIAQDACDRAAREGKLTFAHILDEEAREALAEEDKVKLRVELIQVAASAVRWIEKLDREVLPRWQSDLEKFLKTATPEELADFEAWKKKKGYV